MATITDISQLDLSKQYTYADYLTWRFEGMVELLKGYIYKMCPAPSTYHQRIAGSVFTEINYFLKRNKCRVFIAPFDVRLTRNLIDKEVITVVQPDVCVVCNPDLLDTKGCNGTPDFILEVLSPFTSKKDIVIKYDLYEAAGVGEYWVIYPGENVLKVYLLENGTYKLDKIYGREDKVRLKTLPKLEIDMNDVFDDIL
ncbi:MAG: Uma2 family endonuclease [Cytophagales bacterium]|nr:MAG: Uma2 family endonuclease [Cytophagales bacterium]